jgi:hypothetical protein
VLLLLFDAVVLLKIAHATSQCLDLCGLSLGKYCCLVEVTIASTDALLLYVGLAGARKGIGCPRDLSGSPSMKHVALNVANTDDAEGVEEATRDRMPSATERLSMHHGDGWSVFPDQSRERHDGCKGPGKNADVGGTVRNPVGV